MKKSFMVKFFLFVFFVSVCFVSIPSIAGAQKAIELSFSNFFPAAHKNSKIMEEWIKEIEKRTGGKVKIKYYPGGTLTPAAQVYDGVVKGISDIGESCFAYTRGKFPVMEAVDLPFGYKSGVIATNLVNAVYQKFQPKELADVKVLILHAHGPGIIHTKFPVSKLEDLKGRKIRATGLASKVVTALGAAPVGTAMGETYDALRTGVAEGAMAPAEALQGWKWGEVVANTVQNFGSAYTTAMFVVMNKGKWNSLPKDVQKVFEDVSKEYTQKQAQLWDAIDKEGYDFLKSKGNKIVQLSAAEDARWAKAVQPLLDEYAKGAKAKGLPGDQIVKFCKDFIAKQK
ncbi:MAG TPA: TRAP transporter substrate-binding protein [Syntrophorhabdaceae bacterium]|nr:TRAP transporter substrate-binding protein [Syntrophorhabdaceae bacterium]HRR71793.1 TRAP transporter substrate-binding protein [Syntrophorhabdaceae bacterium]HRV21502.1 TRAP transporter substrate-binding protein [Syntrophorhabdaceae bacterium]